MSVVAHTSKHKHPFLNAGNSSLGPLILWLWRTYKERQFEIVVQLPQALTFIQILHCATEYKT